MSYVFLFCWFLCDFLHICLFCFFVILYFCVLFIFVIIVFCFCCVFALFCLLFCLLVCVVCLFVCFLLLTCVFFAVSLFGLLRLSVFVFLRTTNTENKQISK